MQSVLIVLIIVSGIIHVVTQYLHYKHIARLELLIKSKDLQEVKVFERKPDKATQKTLDGQKLIPNDLQEAIVGKDPDEIRDIFKKLKK